MAVPPAGIDATDSKRRSYFWAPSKAHRPEMVTEHEGEFVLIRGTEIVGFFPDESSALREGRNRFGLVPFLVKQVAATERVIYVPNVVL